MRIQTIALSIGLSLAAGPSLAAGAGSKEESKAPRKTKADEAVTKYNAGIQHLEKADELGERLAGSDAPTRREQLESKRQKEYEKAVEAFRAAIELDGGDHKTYSSLGYGLRKLGDYDASLAAYDEALAREASYTPAIEYRAEAYLALGRLEDVKSAYMKLFTADRARADELEEAMAAWVEERRSDPGDLDAETVDEFATWLEKRQQIAAQTSSNVPPKRGSSW